MIIKRSIEKDVIEHLSKREMTLLVGPRQVGKTTLINDIAESLRGKEEKVLMLNLDIEDDFSMFESQSKLINHIKLNLGEARGYVFIDEVQRKEDAGRFFKGIYDMNLPYKFILTGSGSVELKEKVLESLAGRKRIFEMKPVSFKEFIDYKTDYQFTKKLDAFILSKNPKIELFLNEYLYFGGYPRVVIAQTLEQKKVEMQEIYRSYLEKDLVQLLNIQKTDSFSKLVTVLASQTGKLANIEELSSTLNLDSKTIKNYLWYLEKTFIVEACRPFFTNPRSELVKTPVYYFVDAGMRNYALNRFNDLNLTLQGGQLFENFVYNHIRSEYAKRDPLVSFWRTKDGAEVDFIVKFGTEIVPIEVKYKKLQKSTTGRSMYNFLDKYVPKKAYVVNLVLNETLKREKSEIIFLDYNRFLSSKLI